MEYIFQHIGSVSSGSIGVFLLPMTDRRVIDVYDAVNNAAILLVLLWRRKFPASTATTTAASSTTAPPVAPTTVAWTNIIQMLALRGLNFLLVTLFVSSW